MTYMLIRLETESDIDKQHAAMAVLERERWPNEPMHVIVAARILAAEVESLRQEIGKESDECKKAIGEAWGWEEKSKALAADLADAQAEVERLRAELEADKARAHNFEHGYHIHSTRADEAEKQVANFKANNRYQRGYHDGEQSLRAKLAEAKEKIEQQEHEVVNAKAEVERLSATLELIEQHGGTTTDEGLCCNGSWCAEQARCTLMAEMAEPEPLSRPDKPGKWWRWDTDVEAWQLTTVTDPARREYGFWFPLVSPPAPRGKRAPL